jgi:hypothetical protein
MRDRWHLFRLHLARWIAGFESPQTAYQRRKLEVYRTLTGATVGESLALLNEVMMEIVAPNAVAADVQKQAGALSAIAAKMRFQDFLYLMASATNHTVNANLGTSLPRLELNSELVPR